MFERKDEATTEVYFQGVRVVHEFGLNEVFNVLELRREKQRAADHQAWLDWVARQMHDPYGDAGSGDMLGKRGKDLGMGLSVAAMLFPVLGPNVLIVVAWLHLQRKYRND